MIKGLDYYKAKFHIRTKEEINLGLQRIEEFLQKIGNPQKAIQTVHLAGTNGKGSTLQFLRSILIDAGYQVGTFTSPYLHSVHDQISTNEGPISEEKLEETILYILNQLEDKSNLESLTDFEFLTVLSLVYFARVDQQDIVLYETGMGGLHDSTNVITPLASIITNISLEHTNFLGETLSEISFQKAGIIKDNIPCLTAVDHSEALSVIQKTAAEKNAPLYVNNIDFQIREEQEGYLFQTNDTVYPLLEIGMKGNYQIKNAGLAIMTAIILHRDYSYKIESIHIANGLKQAFWPGRFEMFSQNPLIILDGAHNPDAIDGLVKTLEKEYVDKRIHIIFGALTDKNASSMIKMLERIAHRMTFIDFDFPRAAKAAYLESLCSLESKSSCSHLPECLSAEMNRLGQDEILVITGSLYMIAEVRATLLELNR
ncbi:bifunctional folylpolyglutamate synthase/dihydrofolate synthase [Pseudoneobacillus sp. C159]